MKSITQRGSCPGAPSQGSIAPRSSACQPAWIGIALGVAGLFACGSAAGPGSAKENDSAEVTETGQSAVGERRRPTAPGNFSGPQFGS
jgi:hypothetical protein